ncbi:hypothetical protein ACFWAG_38270, partial [Streptomyces violascens]
LRLPHPSRDPTAASTRPRGITIECPRSRGNFTATKADIAAKAAKKADDAAQQHLAAAGTDALYAGFAAADATSAAAAADRDATEAEKDAASANTAATAAEADASTSNTVATQAEKDATKAETAASNADEAAKDADAAATHAEEEQRKRLEELRKQRADAGSPDVGPDLSSDDEAILLRLCGQECVDEFRAARALSGQDLLAWVKENGGAILLDYIGWTDLKNCLTKGDVESCLWTLVNAVGLAIPLTKIPAVGKAVFRITSGVVGFFEKSAKAKRALSKIKNLIEKAKKEPNTPSCRLKSFSAKASPAAAFAAVDPCDFEPDSGLPYDMLDDLDTRYGQDVADGVNYQWRRMMDGSADSADHILPGIGQDFEAMAKYFEGWRGKGTYWDTLNKTEVAYDQTKGVIIILKSTFIHGYKKAFTDFGPGLRYTPLPKK